MTAFDSVTATISPAMSTYIRCKGKVWKNAFISSLQRIAGVEYSVYKKKGSWQIRGDWINIKQAHKILMKVTTSEDWVSLSVPEPASAWVKPKVAKPTSLSKHKSDPVPGIEEAFESSEVVEASLIAPNKTNHLSRSRRSLRQNLETPVYNEEQLALQAEIKSGSVEDQPNEPVVFPLAIGEEEIKRVDDIKIEDGEGSGEMEELPTNSDGENLNFQRDQVPKSPDDQDLNSVDKPTAKPTSPKKEPAQSRVNRRKRGRPRKVTNPLSYLDASINATNDLADEIEKNISDNPNGDPQMEDLMDVGDSDDDNDDNQSDDNDKDFSIDGMIKEGKDNIKSMKKFFSCLVCEFKCKSRTSLDEHKQRLHGNRQFKCPICDKVYGVKRDLKKHIRRHTSQYKCERCGKTYKEQRNYRQHLRTHDDDYIPPQFACEQCEKSFTTKYVLQAHVDQIHNGKVPEWLCNVCGKKFKQKHSLQEHHLIHTGERPFTCKICNKSFRHKGSLVNHEQLHTDIRLYTCEVCGKDFKHRNSLRIHAVVHSKFRNFECPVCSKKFTQKQALNRHARIHSGEKPFMCELCGDRFNDNSILRRHMMGIHKTELKSGKQHFVLPTEHYTQPKVNPNDQEIISTSPTSTTAPMVPAAPILQPQESEAKNDFAKPIVIGPTSPVTNLPDYRPGSDTPPSLRAFDPHSATMYQDYRSPAPMAAGPSAAQFSTVTMSTAAMAAAAAALGATPMANMTGQFAGHPNNPTVPTDRPIPLTSSNNQFPTIQQQSEHIQQQSEQLKSGVLPSNMQYHRMY